MGKSPKEPKLGKDVAGVPGQISQHHKRADADEQFGILASLHGTGFLCDLALYTSKIAKKGEYKHNEAPPPPVIGDFNGQVDALETPAMKIRYKDFMAFSQGRILGDKELVDTFIGELDIAAADGTFDRHSLIVLEPIQDDSGSHLSQGGLWSVIEGTPSAAPELPALTSTQQIISARVIVRAGTTSILPSDINNDDFKECVLTADIIKAAFNLTGDDLSALEMRVEVIEDLLSGATAPVGVIADIISDLSDLSAIVDDIKNQECTDTNLIDDLDAGTATTSSAQLVTDKDSLVTAVAGESVALKAQVDGIAEKVKVVDFAINTFSSLVTSFASQTTLMSEDILGLRLDLSSIMLQLFALDEELSVISLTGAADTARDAMQADIVAINGQLSPVNGQITALVGCISMSAASVPTMDSLLNDIGGKLGKITSDLSNIRGAFDLLLSEFDSLVNQVNSNSDRLSVLEDIVGGASDLCEEFGQYGSGAGDIDRPAYMSAGKVSGKVYVAEINNARISVFDSAGAYVTSHDVSPEFPNEIIIGVELNDAEDLMFVGSNGSHGIVYDMPGFTVAATIGTPNVPSATNGEFNLPFDGAWNSSDELYVSDLFNHRVQHFAAGTYAYIDQIGDGTPGLTLSPFRLQAPRSVRVDTSNDDVYITETSPGLGGNRVIRMNSAHVFQNFIGAAAATLLDVDNTTCNALGFGFGQRNSIAEMANGNILYSLTYRQSLILDPVGGVIAGFISNLLSSSFTGSGAAGRAMSSVKIPAGGTTPGKLITAAFGFDGVAGQNKLWSNVSLTPHDGLSGYTDAVSFTIPESVDIAPVNGELTVDPQGHLYAIVQHGGGAAASLYKSVDEALTWTLENNDVFAGNSVADATVVAYGNGNLLAHTNGGRQSRSTDAGANWTYEGNTGVSLLGNPFLQKMADGRLLIMGITGVFAGGTGFQLSDDDGASWGSETQTAGLSNALSQTTSMEKTNGDLVFADVDLGIGQEILCFADTLAGTAVSGNGNGEFNRPQQVAITADQVEVADGFNNRVQRFTKAGVFQSKTFPRTARFPDGSVESAFISGIALAKSGAIWVAGDYGDNVRDGIAKCRKPEQIVAKINESNTAVDVMIQQLKDAPNNLTVDLLAIQKL